MFSLHVTNVCRDGGLPLALAPSLGCRRITRLAVCVSHFTRDALPLVRQDPHFKTKHYKRRVLQVRVVCLVWCGVCCALFMASDVLRLQLAALLLFVAPSSPSLAQLSAGPAYRLPCSHEARLVVVYTFVEQHIYI